MTAEDGAFDDNAFAVREELALEKYLQENQVEEIVAELVHRLLAAKPDNPRQWLLDMLDKEISDESNELAETDLHRLFAVTQKITSEIFPLETINIVISETLGLLSCDWVSLFVFDRKMHMLRLYTSDLASPIMVSPGQGIVGSVLANKQVVNIPDCYQDHRFDRSVDQDSGYVTKSLIAVPIVDFHGAAVGVLQAVNKLRFTGRCSGTGSSTSSNLTPGASVVPFRRNDEKIMLHLAPHVSIALRNAEVYREAISASERSMGLLNTIQSMSHDLGGQSLLLTVTMHATKIVGCERATVFMVDELNQQLWSMSADTGQEIRIPKGLGIAGHCCDDARVINIRDADADSRFNREVDSQTGFETRSVLAVPVFDHENIRQTRLQSAARSRRNIPGNDLLELEHRKRLSTSGTEKIVIGVIQMINKVSYDGQLEVFDEGDIEVMELFAKFVSPKLANSAIIPLRATDLSDKREAELALRPNLISDHDDRTERVWKRLVSKTVALDALVEEGELHMSPG